MTTQSATNSSRGRNRQPQAPLTTDKAREIVNAVDRMGVDKAKEVLGTIDAINAKDQQQQTDQQQQQTDQQQQQTDQQQGFKLESANPVHAVIIASDNMAVVARSFMAQYGKNKATEEFTKQLKIIDPSFIAGKPCFVLCTFVSPFTGLEETKEVALHKAYNAFRNAVSLERDPKKAPTPPSDMQKAVSLAKRLKEYTTELPEELLEHLESFVSEHDK